MLCLRIPSPWYSIPTMNRYNRSNTRPVLLWYCGKLQFLRVKKKNLMVTPPWILSIYISIYIIIFGSRICWIWFCIVPLVNPLFFSNLSKSKWWFLPHDLCGAVGITIGDNHRRNLQKLGYGAPTSSKTTAPTDEVELHLLDPPSTLSLYII